MVVISTAISGTGEKEYIARLMGYALRRGKKIKEFSTGEMFFEQAKLSDIRAEIDNIFHMDHNTARALRGGVYRQILAEIPSLIEKEYSVLINLHGSFFMDDQYTDSVDYHYLSALNPDFYVNFMGNSDVITKTLQQRRQFRFLFDKRDYQYVLGRIMEWQTVEILATKIVSSFSRKKLYIIPAGGSESVLYRLMFEPWRSIFYLGMPLTYLHGEDKAVAREHIEKFVQWANRYVVIIDPRYVEPLKPNQLTNESKNISVRRHVVGRDLRSMIPQCHGMIGIYPDAVTSYGEAFERREMFALTGDTFLIYPGKELSSPFFSEWSADETFSNEEEFKSRFLEYLGKEYLAKVEESERCYDGGDYV